MKTPLKPSMKTSTLTPECLSSLRKLAHSNELTLLVDSREKQPLMFPANLKVYDPSTRSRRVVRLTTVRRALDYGDYCLENLDSVVCIERKGGPAELAGNLLSRDAARQGRALGRLVGSCRFPTLLVEASPQKFMEASTQVPDPELLANRLWNLVAQLGLRLLWVPKCMAGSTRRRLGAFVAHYLYSTAAQAALELERDGLRAAVGPNGKR
jgi:ERCC4-type nuclease